MSEPNESLRSRRTGRRTGERPPIEPDESELDAYLIGDLDAEVDDWRPDLDDAQADRSLRAVAAIDRQLARYEALAKAERDRIDAWLAEVSNPLVGRREFFVRCLETYARANHEATGAKSMKLPNGTLQLRAGRTRVEATDDPSEDAPAELVRVKREWDKNRIAEDFNPGGIVEDPDTPPGFVTRQAVHARTGEVSDRFVFRVPVERTFSLRAGGGS